MFSATVSRTTTVGGMVFFLELRILNLIMVVEARVRDEFEVAGDLHVGMNTGSLKQR